MLSSTDCRIRFCSWLRASARTRSHFALQALVGGDQLRGALADAGFQLVTDPL